MGDMKSRKEIEKEITLLKKIKPNIRRMSIFGDDNHEVLDAQIAVLDENLDEDDIYTRWNPADKIAEHEGATEAYLWMTGESEYESLVEGWEGLVQKK